MYADTSDSEYDLVDTIDQYDDDEDDDVYIDNGNQLFNAFIRKTAVRYLDLSLSFLYSALF